MKIVINKCYGGFAMSEEQAKAYGIPEEDLFEGFIPGEKVYYGGYNLDRTDPKLVEVVEQGLPNARASELQVVEIPDGAFYNIEEYDGLENVLWSMSEINYA